MGMMVLDGGFPAGLLVALVIFFLISIGVIMVLWMALPFSVFGIKDLIRQCLKEQKETNEILKSIVEGEGADKTDE